MTTTTTQELAKSAGRPKGGPGMIIILLVVLVPALLLGNLVGAGGASIVGGFVALFGLISSMGGALRADLARFAFVGPLIAFGAVAPRLLAEASVAGAIGLTVALILVAGLLPIRGHRYDPVSLAVGMGTLFGYAIPFAGSVRPGQLLLAGATGLVLALVLRLLLGIADPSGPTRKSVGDLLDGTGSDFGSSFEAWLSDRPTRWVGDVLVAAGRFRLARAALVGGDASKAQTEITSFVEAADDRARTIANAVRAKKPVVLEPAPVSTAPAVLQKLRAGAATTMLEALDEATRAFQVRDAERVPLPSGFRSRLASIAVRAGIRHGSIQIRHAYRTAVAILLALILSTFLRHGDPLLPTLLMTTFGIMQASFDATLTKARDRLLGLVAGGVISVLVILFLPNVLLLPISLVGLAVGMWFITARPAVGVAGILVMSVGLNSELRHLQPLDVVIEYVILTAIAVVIAVVIGFGVIPAWRPKGIAVRVDAAVDSTAIVLTTLANSREADTPETALEVLGDATAATQQLVPARDKLSKDQEQEVRRLRESLQDLLTTTLFLTSTSDSGSSDLAFRAAANVLKSSSDESIVDAKLVDEAVVLLAQEVREQREAVMTSLALRQEP